MTTRTVAARASPRSARRERRRRQLDQHRARQRRHLARRAAGRVVVPLEVDEQLLDFLVRLQWLADAQAHDAAAIAEAIVALLQDAAEADRRSR